MRASLQHSIEKAKQARQQEAKDERRKRAEARKAARGGA
jgi:hypothetical protein